MANHQAMIQAKGIICDNLNFAVSKELSDKHGQGDGQSIRETARRINREMDRHGDGQQADKQTVS